MSSDIAIKVENLSKCYQIYDQPRDRLKQFILPRLQGIIKQPPKQYFREFWALKDVSFEVKKGETVGIIGRNGSGKSTLLQMICGTLNPTSGSIKTHGRIAALLELGAGFNPEFTGRENVHMNAAVLGLRTDEIDRRFNDIVAFADIGDFIEQPVKTYSSGMMVRLAFAVAINVEPQILIIDEALAVGDELFQRKCFSRIEAIRSAGSTILFVSHSGLQVVELCDRALLIDIGEKLAVGSPKQIVNLYQKLLFAPADKRETIKDQIRQEDSVISIAKCKFEIASKAHAKADELAHELQETFDVHLKPSTTFEYEAHGVVIDMPKILTITGERVNGLVRGRKYRYCYRVDFSRSAKNVRFGMAIKTISGLHLGGAHSAPSINEALPVVDAEESIEVEFEFNCHLNPGTYFMNAGVFGFQGAEEKVLHRKVDATVFRVLPVQSNIETEVISFGFSPKIRTHE
jgi:lipopolysaccharide transport system ATP-binding protein